MEDRWTEKTSRCLIWPGYIIQELLDNLSASAGYDKGSQFIEPDRPGTGKKKSSGTKKKDGEKSLEELLNEIIEDVKNSIPVSETSRPRVPNERSNRVREENLEQGIPVDERVWETILAL